MKKILLLAFLLPFSKSFSQNITFQLAIGGAGYENAYGIMQAPDGDYLLLGQTVSYGAGGNDAYIVKISPTGNLVWAKAIGSSADDGVSNGCPTNDGGFIFSGSTNGFGAGGYDIYLIKTDVNGTLQWTKTIGAAGDEHANEIIQTSDSGFAISGVTTSSGAGGNDVYVIKLTSGFAVQWAKTIGGTGDDQGCQIVQTSDKGFIIGGLTNSFGAGDYDFYALKLDSLGNLLWTKTVGGSGREKGYDMTATSDGGVALTGYTTSFGSGQDVYVVKLTGTGSLQWSEALGGPGIETCSGIVQMSDGGYVVSGITTSFGASYVNGYTVKLDGSGSIVWSTITGGANDNRLECLKKTNDGELLAAGYTTSFGAGAEDFYVVKITAGGSVCASLGNGGTITSGGTAGSGGILNNALAIVIDAGGSVTNGQILTSICLEVGIDEQTSKNSLIIFPNPSEGKFAVFLSDQIENGMLEIFNSLGQKIYSEKFSVSDDKEEINLRVEPGIYFVKVSDGEKIFTKKLIIQ